MEIRARTKGNVIILDLAGRIDVDAANLVEAIGQCLRDGYSDILCNLEEIDFIDYLGVSAIALAFREVVNNKGRMKFANVPAHIKNVLAVTGIDRVIEIYATEDIALNTFKEDKVIENIKKMQLRRRFKRLPIDIKAQLTDKFAKTAKCISVDILNLSAIGAYIYGCDKFRLGDDVLLKFKLPPGEQEWELKAKVVWLPDKHIQIHLQPGMGVEFYDLPAALQEKLVEFIERNLSRLPQEE